MFNCFIFQVKLIEMLTSLARPEGKFGRNFLLKRAEKMSDLETCTKYVIFQI